MSGPDQLRPVPEAHVEYRPIHAVLCKVTSQHHEDTVSYPMDFSRDLLQFHMLTWWPNTGACAPLRVMQYASLFPTGSAFYGLVTRRRMKSLRRPKLSLTEVVTGLVAPTPLSSTISGGNHPLLLTLVAMPRQAAVRRLVLASTINVTSVAFVLRLNRNQNSPLDTTPPMRARLSELVGLDPVAYFRRFGYPSPVAQSVAFVSPLVIAAAQTA